MLFLHGERVNELVARVERRVDGPRPAERVLEVVDEALEEVERTREDGEENRLELRAPQVYQQKRGQTTSALAHEASRMSFISSGRQLMLLLG